MSKFDTGQLQAFVHVCWIGLDWNVLFHVDKIVEKE